MDIKPRDNQFKRIFPKIVRWGIHVSCVLLIILPLGEWLNFEIGRWEIAWGWNWDTALLHMPFILAWTIAQFTMRLKLSAMFKAWVIITATWLFVVSWLMQIPEEFFNPGYGLMVGLVPLPACILYFFLIKGKGKSATIDAETSSDQAPK